MAISPTTRKRLGFVGKILLGALATGAVLTMFAVAPGAAEILKLFEKKKVRVDRGRLKREIERLQKRKFIDTEELPNGSIRLTITEEGKENFREYQMKDLKIAKPGKWDKKWRVVAFDIPEERKDAREVLRNKLKDLGFAQLQKSVFVCPYPCQKEIAQLTEIMLIQKYVTLLTAEHTDDLRPLAKRFSV